MSFSPRFTITNAITAALTRIERARGFLDAAKLSEDWISKMQNRALILEAHHTTHIEGTRLTLEQSERILGGKRVQGARPDDAQELLNYKKAQALKVNRRTLQRDLKLLVDKGLATQVATSPTAPTKFYQPLL